MSGLALLVGFAVCEARCLLSSTATAEPAACCPGRAEGEQPASSDAPRNGAHCCPALVASTHGSNDHGLPNAGVPAGFAEVTDVRPVAVAALAPSPVTPPPPRERLHLRTHRLLR